jgi:hypothetical protein
MMWAWNWWRILPRWVLVLVTVLAVILVIVEVVWVSTTLDGIDIPCQDGHWDEAQNTCIPDPSVMP